MVRRGHFLALTTALLAGLVCAPAAHATCSPTAANPVAEPARPITPDDLVRLADIGTPDPSLFDMPSPLALSPDGRTLAFVQNRGDPATNSYCRLLIVVDVERRAVPHVLDQGGELIMLSDDVRGLRVTVGLAATVTPGWSPDGRSLGYLRRDRGITQLWRVSAAGGDAKPVTRSPVDIEQWAWVSNDRVVVASRPEQITQRARDDAEGRSGWVYDARFSPEYAARPQLSGDLPLRFDAIDLATGGTRPATAAETALLANGGVGGSGDDALTIVTAHGGRGWVQADDTAPLSPGRVHVADAHGRESRCAAPQCAGGIVRLYGSADGHGIVYLRREGWAKSQFAFYRWDPARGAPTRLSATSDLLLGCLARGAHFLCLREASASPRRIVDVDPATGRAITIYDPNPAFAALRLGTVERLFWRNDLGLPAWGDLVLPPGHAATDKLPLVVVQYHSLGFLRGGTGDEYPIFPLAARGFAVLSVEDPPSIAAAYPKLKTWEEVDRAGMKDWADRRSMLSSILNGVAQVVARGIVDPRRIGITGLSDGASSARFALINSRVFSAAAISSSSLEPKTAMTYGGIAWADFNRTLGYPPASEDAPAFWKPFSVAQNAKDMNVPLLIQAADDEYLLALETFTALREHHKPVDMYVYPHEHHVKWQPAHRLAVYERDIDWFAFWFQNIVDRDPTKAPEYARWTAMRARLGASSTGSGGARQP